MGRHAPWLLVLALVMAMCGGERRGFKVPALERAPRIVPKWQQPLQNNPIITYRPRETAAPVIDRAQNAVIVGSNAGVLHSFDLESGALRWRQQVSGPIWAPALVAAGTVYVGTADGTVEAFEARTGEPAWDEPYRTTGAVWAAPAFAGGRLFVTFDTNELHALDAEVGTLLWRRSREHLTAFTLTGHAAPLVWRDTVITGFSDGMLTAFRLEDGSPTWHQNLSGELSRFVDADGDPVIDDGVLYATSNAGGVFALDPDNGEILWNHRVSGASSPTVTARHVYVTLSDARELRSLSRDDGRLVWQSGVHRGTPSTPVFLNAPDGGYLLFSNTYSVLLVSGGDGRHLERLTSAEGFTARPTLAPGMVLQLSNRGHLHAWEIY